MLDEILDHLRNYFVTTAERGTYEIKDGMITPPLDLEKGQYFRIVGSLLNDGVYQSMEGLLDETFTGEIWLLAVPRSLVTLAQEIRAYEESEMSSPSPYISENYFGQYGYQRAKDGEGIPISDWRTVFAKKLNRWRKI